MRRHPPLVLPYEVEIRDPVQLGEILGESQALLWFFFSLEAVMMMMKAF